VRFVRQRDEKNQIGLPSFDRIISPLSQFDTVDFGKQYYVNHGCSCDNGKSEVRDQLVIPNGYSYYTHNFGITTRNPNSQSTSPDDTTGWELTLDGTKTRLSVYLWAKDQSACFQLLGCHGPTSWLGMFVHLIATKNPPPPPPPTGHGVEITFNSGTDAAGGLVELWNPPAPPQKQYASRELAPNIGPDQCAVVLNACAGDTDLQSVVAGPKVTIYSNDNIGWRITPGIVDVMEF